MESEVWQKALFVDFGKYCKHLIWGFCLTTITGGNFEWGFPVINHFYLFIFSPIWTFDRQRSGKGREEARTWVAI